VSHYIKRMVTDTVSPHAAGIKFAIDYYGIDNVMYGSDYPCWEPAEALELISTIDLSEADRHKLFVANVRRIFNLRDPQGASAPRREPALT
jgi:aminocarboxymuconate-semialdehyde decarboxylase